MKRLVLLLAPLVSGLAIMGLELVGLRLLAPRFGASIYVWGGLLGTIMAALALGYLAGGALADRRPRPQWVFGLLLAGGAWVAVDLLMSKAVLDGAERLGATLGPIVATAVLLAPPMIVLGSVSPFVVKLEGQLSSLGVTAGRVFALSTAGSLVGTFVTAFWWIPDYGCRHTLRILVAALVALGIAGLAWPAARAGRAALAVALAGLPFLVPDPPLVAGSLFAGESPYNTVVVEAEGEDRLLCLNDAREGSHSVRLGHGLLTGGYYDVLYLGPLLGQGRRILVLGMGGGTTVGAYRRLYPGAHVTAVEIDPLVVRVAHEYLGLEPGGRPRGPPRGRPAVPEAGERVLRRHRGGRLRRQRLRPLLLPHRRVLRGGAGQTRAQRPADDERLRSGWRQHARRGRRRDWRVCSRPRSSSSWRRSAC